MMEQDNDRPALSPISFFINLSVASAIGSAAVWQRGANLRAAASANQQLSSEGEASWPGVRTTRRAHGKSDQIFRLAQVLLQNAWNEHRVPDHDHRYI